MECCDNIELAVGLILRDEGGKFLQLLFIQRIEMCQWSKVNIENRSRNEMHNTVSLF